MHGTYVAITIILLKTVQINEQNCYHCGESQHFVMNRCNRNKQTNKKNKPRTLSPRSHYLGSLSYLSLDPHCYGNFVKT